MEGQSRGPNLAQMRLSSSSLLQLLLVLLVAAMPAALSSSSCCNFPAIINLGDSNSDTGGLSAALSPVAWPDGETFFKSPAGRFSDGRLIIDFIAESLGFPLLSAYLDSVGANFSHGANFASGGAAIICQNYSHFPLDVQVRELLQFNTRSQLLSAKGGVFADLLPKKGYLARALYTLDIGHNDVTEAYAASRSPDKFIPDAMERFSAAVESIYNEIGGRSFWIHNTGPLGCLPHILKTHLVPETQLDPIGCGKPLNELTQQFNRALNETVAELRRDLPLAAITFVDVYSVKYSLFKNAEKNGFEQPLAACCVYGGSGFNIDSTVLCGQSPILVNGTLVQAEACKVPSKRIIWDGIHYTEAGNRWVFDKISRGAFSYPPISLKMTCRRNAPLSSF